MSLTEHLQCKWPLNISIYLFWDIICIIYIDISIYLLCSNDKEIFAMLDEIVLTDKEKPLLISTNMAAMT